MKRASTNRNWLGGMGWKPAAAWGLSLLFVVGLITSVVVWSPDGNEASIHEVLPIDESVETAGTLNSIAEMRQTDVFDDLLQLDVHETESLKLLLQDLTRDRVNPQ